MWCCWLKLRFFSISNPDVSKLCTEAPWVLQQALEGASGYFKFWRKTAFSICHTLLEYLAQGSSQFQHEFMLPSFHIFWTWVFGFWHNKKPSAVWILSCNRKWKLPVTHDSKMCTVLSFYNIPIPIQFGSSCSCLRIT